MSPLVVMFAWALWHDLSLHRASGFMRHSGRTYQVSSYDTKAECEAEEVAAMAKEELPGAGPRAERLLDGIKVWAPDLDAIQEPLGPWPCPRQLLLCHRRDLLSLTLGFRVVRGDLVRRAGERQELSGTVDAQVVPEGPGEHHDEWAHALILPTPRWGTVPRSRLTSSISRYKLYIK